MAFSSKLVRQEVVDAGQACSGKDLSVWNPILPLDVEEFSETGCVEVVQLPLAWRWYTVHVSLAYSSVRSTIALYTLRIVCRLITLSVPGVGM